MKTKHEVSADNAPTIREWLASRGGLAVWRSVNLSNPGASWTTPRLTADGQPMPRPTWQADTQPERIITDPSEIVVVEPREVRRFHVAVRRSSNGLMLKLTDASTQKVRAATARAGQGAWYAFDYDAQEAVIYVPGAVTPL